MKKIFLLHTLLFLAWSASAAIYNLTASLDGAQEVGPNSSTATGSLTATYDDVTNQITYSVTYAGLGSALIAGHLHGNALPGVNAGVKIGFTISASPIVGVGTVLEADELALLGGMWYVNLHTTNFPGGEIRGQVSVVLPVELISFEAIVRNGMVYLDWKTATELNNDYFQIARSQDGRSFTDIGTVKGQGTSQETKNYNYADRLPAKGFNYYRLQQVDTDGAYKYSAVVTVQVEMNEIQIFPNPTAGILEFHSPFTEGIILVTDSMGKLVQQQDLSQGQIIDVSRQPNGVYFVALQVGNQTTIKRIVKE